MNRRTSTRMLLLLVAFAVLAAGIGYSVHTLYPRLHDARILPLVAVFLCTVPVTVVLATWRFKATSALAGPPLSFSTCLTTVTLGTAANFLPLPGAFAVRLHALRHHGLRRGTYTNITATLVWLSVSAAYAALSAVALHVRVTGLAFAGIALASALASVISCRYCRLDSSQLQGLYMIQLLLSGIDIVRLWVVGQSLAAAIGPAQAGVLGFSGVAGTLSGMLPGGIGITEGIAAALAAVISTPPAYGFLIAAVNRLLVWAGILPTAAVLMLRGAHRPGTDVDSRT